MLCRFRSLSRAVHEERVRERQHERKKTYPRTEATMGTSLTVWRKSLLISCKGFTVIDSEGNLVYRVDNYMGRPDEITLMDASGKSVLTVRRRSKKLVVVESWNVYAGEVGNHQRKSSEERPICCVRKRVNIFQGKPKVQAYVYREASDKKRYDFAVEGSYAYRTCKVVDASDKVVAEIRRKEAIAKDVSFGIEIFQLIVHPGFDPGFAMALVLLLDQMFS
ncbi:protein LURP-one-related 17-like [Prosopis cineraria]|uniref:protein LURP-one-related 17-like n=1 Tax=Prosopis cineraria TaxID=364024 RepID=UPI00240EC63E|nr:protein LURP-one-related 17-like [Prosopis cineraria]